MNQQLIITDGTVSVDLLKHFRLKSHITQAPRPKGGGVWRQSPFLDGRQPILRKLDDVIDTFELVAHSSGSADTLISMVRQLRQLLEKSVDYWTTKWAKEPVWIVARGICETGTRYAVISGYNAPQDGDMYELPTNVFDEWNLIVEHKPWQEHLPDTLHSIEASGQMDTIGEQVLGQYSWAGGIVDSVAGVIAANTTYVVDDSESWVVELGVNALPGAGVMDWFVSRDPLVAFRFAQIEISNTGDLRLFEWDGSLNIAERDIITWLGAGTVGPGDTLILFKRNDTLYLYNNGALLAKATIFTPECWISEQGLISPAGAGSFDNLFSYSFDYVLGTMTYGQTATEAHQLLISNGLMYDNIQYVYFYDASGPNWTNRSAAALPYTFLPAVPAVGDTVYFGSSRSWFWNIVLDIGDFWGKTIIGGHTGVWETYTIGPGWQTAVSLDNTNSEGRENNNAFNTPGVNAVNIFNVSVSNQANLNTLIGGAGAPNFSAFWVRYRITAIDGLSQNTPPTQQNRKPYTCVMPYIDIADDQTSGDIPSLMYSLLECESADQEKSVGHPAQAILAGVRSLSRGDFAAYINISGRHVPDGITVTVPGGYGGGGNILWGTPNDSNSYVTAAAGTEQVMASILISPEMNYIGTFKAFLRLTESFSGTNTFFIRYGWADTFGNMYAVGESKRGTAGVIDLGQIDIQPSNMLDNGYLQIDIYVQDDLASAVNMIDLVLIPTDEFAFFVFQPDTELTRLDTGGVQTYGIKTELHVDSVTTIKRNIKAGQLIQNREVPNDGVYQVANWFPVTTGEHAIQHTGDQRIWYFMIEDIDDLFYAANERGYALQLLSANFYKTGRFYTLRGNG